MLSVGDTAGTAAHFQALANAGQGIQPGQPNAPYYPSTSPAELSSALQSIVGKFVRSCNFTLSSPVDPSHAQSGQITLNNMTLNYGTDWTLDASGMTLELIGNACNALKQSLNPIVDAVFPCSAHS